MALFYFFKFGFFIVQEMRQHDVQELNRILFSALETSLVGTSGHDLIKRLYHGIVVNQIVCKECKNISERQVKPDYFPGWVSAQSVEDTLNVLCFLNSKNSDILLACHWWSC